MKKTSGWLLLYIWNWMQHMLAGIHLFRVKIRKLEQGVKYVQSMFCTENKQTRGGSWTPRSSMMELFVTMEVIFHWQSSSDLDDGGIVEMPLYAIIFSLHDKIGSMEENKDPENSSISHTDTFFPYLGGRSIIFCFLCWETVVPW